MTQEKFNAQTETYIANINSLKDELDSLISEAEANLQNVNPEKEFPKMPRTSSNNLDTHAAFPTPGWHSRTGAAADAGKPNWHSQTADTDY